MILSESNPPGTPRLFDESIPPMNLTSSLLVLELLQGGSRLELEEASRMMSKVRELCAEAVPFGANESALNSGNVQLIKNLPTKEKSSWDR